MDYSSLISKRRDRFSELEEAVGDPELFSDPKRATEILREHGKLKQTLALWDNLEAAKRHLAENQELAKSDDPDFSAMAAEEIPGLESEIERMGTELQYALLPSDPSEDRDALVEIRAGAGGDEASLFAAELMRMYQRYADLSGWKSEHLESSPSEVGGFKEVILKITGQEVFRYLKYESGVHRVQRVPSTETQGRVHTSTVTVAVLAGGGGSRCRAQAGGPADRGLPRGRCRWPARQPDRVRRANFPPSHRPVCPLRRRPLADQEQGNGPPDPSFQALRPEAPRTAGQAYSSHRRSLIGSGDRSEKIRTYNFPQSRITDHRIGYTSHNLTGVIAGDLTEFTAELQKTEMDERLAEAGL